MSDAFTQTSVNQSGKSGGDTSGFAGAGSSAFSGGGSALTGVTGKVTGSMSLSASADGGYSDSGASAMAGGDVTDNTSIGNININS